MSVVLSLFILFSSHVAMGCDNLKLKNIREIKKRYVGFSFNRCVVENFSYRNSDFRGAKINNSRFVGGDFIGSNFSQAMITDSVFQDCILPLNFSSNATLINVRIINCRYQ